MGKRTFSIVLALALVVGVISALPATAQDAPPPTVPAVVNIEDPRGDANYINNQGLPLPIPGDTPVTDQVGTVSDILKVWFTSDAATVSAHILTNAAPPASTPLIFHVRVDPGTGSNCLWFRTSFPSVVQGQADPVTPRRATLRDTCATALPISEGTLNVGTTADGDGVTSMTFPRSAYPTFVDGAVLKAPTADSRNFPAGQLTVPQIDDTKPGTDFTITSGGPIVAPAPEPTEEPPGKSDPPGKGKKKGCKKGKGKKKGACPGKPKPPVTPACPAYVPGDEGAEAETTIVTDAATEEKPVVVELDAGAGLGSAGPYDETTSLFQNIQVDTASADTGLYVKFEFPNMHDYDLYLNYADGSTAANSGDFNAGAGHDLGSGSPDGAWEAGSNYESVLGIRTADCAGYTARLVSWLTNGGAVTLSLWVGEVVAEPAASGGGEEALSTFWSLMTPREARSSSGARVAAKKKKKPRKPPVCGTFTPGELGTDKPLLKVTDAATEEAPAEQTITLAGSVADADLSGDLPDEGPLAASSDFFNIQVDSANSDAGLYILWEFPDRRDYDLEVLHTDSSYAARSHDFNPICGSPISCSNGGHAGEAGTNFEKILGIRTLDCAGWTVEAVNWLGEGGELTVTAWLGDVANEPQALGAEPHV